MKIASSVTVMLIGSIASLAPEVIAFGASKAIGSLLLTDTAHSSILPNHDRQFFTRKISIKPPVTLQVRQYQAIELINKMLKQQISHRSEGNNSEFLQNFDELKIAPLTGQDTDELGGYKYSIETKDGSIVLHTATPQLPKLRAYFGLIHSYTSPTQLQVFDLIICESKKTHRKQPSIKIADIAIANGNLICLIGHQKFTVLVPPTAGNFPEDCSFMESLARSWGALAGADSTFLVARW